MNGCLGDAPAKGKARPAKRPALPDVAAAAPRTVAARCWAGELVALAGAETVALPAAAWPGRGGGYGPEGEARRACAVVDVWGRPAPPWLAHALPAGVPLHWARAAGPAAAAGLLEALLQRREFGRVVLRVLGELWALPPWPRRASGMLALAQHARASGSSVVALLGCPPGGGCLTPPAAFQASLLSGPPPLLLYPLDAAHAAAPTNCAERGREFLAWASLRAQTCQCAPAALP